MRTLKRSTNIVKKAYEGLGNYLSPSNFTYMWSLGSLALICLIIQIISGLFLFSCINNNMAFIVVNLILWLITAFMVYFLLFKISLNGAFLNPSSYLLFIAESWKSIKSTLTCRPMWHEKR